MRRSLAILALIAFCATGCARYYQITLQNGNRITTRGKPKYDRGFYVFRDLNGRTNEISESRVRLIEPRPRGFTEETGFDPSKRK